MLSQRYTRTSYEQDSLGLTTWKYMGQMLPRQGEMGENTPFYQEMYLGTLENPQEPLRGKRHPGCFFAVCNKGFFQLFANRSCFSFC